MRGRGGEEGERESPSEHALPLRAAVIKMEGGTEHDLLALEEEEEEEDEDKEGTSTAKGSK